MPVIEIKPENEFYDYHSKYFSDATEYHMPPVNVSEEVCKKAQKISIKACEVLGIHSFSRVDLLVKDGEPLLMEVNTIPGLTKHSLLPKTAKQAGLSFTELIDRMIQLGLSRKKPYIEDPYANLS